MLMMVCIFALAGCGKEPDHIPAMIMEANIQAQTQKTSSTFIDPNSAYQIIQLFVEQIESGVIDDDFLNTMEHNIKKDIGSRKEDLVILKAISSYIDNVEDIGFPLDVVSKLEGIPDLDAHTVVILKIEQ